MKKTIVILTSLLVIVSMASGCSNKASNSESTNSYAKVENMDFDFEVKPETFEVCLDSNGRKELLSSPSEKRKVSNLKKSKDFISWTYPDESIDIEIKKVDKYLDINIKSTKDGEAAFKWPNVEGENYVLPIDEGKFIPSDNKDWIEFLNGQKYDPIESFSMQFFSVEKKDYSLTYIMENKYNNEIEFKTDDKINFTFTHEYPSVNKNREYGFRIYMTDKNVVDAAKTYKNYVVEKGEFKTLEEKSKTNKNIEKLYGAPHIYFWGESAISDDDIVWSNLKNEMSAALIKKISDILEVQEDGKELIAVFNQIKSQDYIDKYQKNQIVRSLNIALMSDKLYDKDVFKSINNKTDKEIAAKSIKLAKTELVDLNKKVLKSELKNSTKDVKEWGRNNTTDLVENIYKSGIKNAWIGFDDIDANFVSKDLVKKSSDLGYLVAPYDSYHSIHKPGEEKWGTASFKDKSLYESATIENKKGEKEVGFQGEGRKLNPTLSMPSVKERVASILKEGYKFNSWFIDCDATGEIYDDYSKNHTTTKEQDLNARLKRMSYIRDDKNMVIGSEGGNDFASTTIAFAHGIETPAFSWVDPDMSKNKESEYYVGRYYSASGGVPDVFSKQIPMKDKYKKVFIDPDYSIPLYKLVYNNSVISTHQWLWGTFKVEDEVGSRMMKEVLYNVPSMYHIDRSEWNKHKDEIISHNNVWSEFSKKAIKEEMLDFRILSEDRLVQETVYGKDLRVIANFSDKDYKKDGNVVKANSLVIYDGNKKIEYKPE